MGITQNPVIDFNTQQPSLYYYNDGACIGACIGSPEGMIAAGFAAILADILTGNLYVKQTSSGATGWVKISTGSGGSPPGGNPYSFQFNNTGTFGGANEFLYEENDYTLSLTPISPASGFGIIEEGATPTHLFAGGYPALQGFTIRNDNSYWAIGIHNDQIDESVGISMSDDGALYIGNSGESVYGETYIYPEGILFFNEPFGTYYGLMYQVAPDNYALGVTTFSPVVGQTPILHWNDSRVRLGTPSTKTVRLELAVSGSANTQSIQAADTPASSSIIKLPAADPTAGQALVASAPSGGVITLSYANIISGSLTTPRIPYMGGAGSLVDTPNFTWTNSLNRVTITGTSGAGGYIVTEASTPASSAVVTPGFLAAQLVSNIAGNAAALQLTKIRGALEWPNAGDSLGNIDFLTSDGVQIGGPCRINVAAATAHSITNQGSSLTLSLTPNGSTSRTTRLTINGTGEWNLHGLIGFRNGNPFTPLAPIHVVCNTTNEGIYVDSNTGPGTVRGAIFSDGTDLFVGAITDDLVNLISNGTAIIRFTKDTIGFFGVPPVTRQPMGSATAGVIYGANEQNMLQAVYNAVRNLGLGT